MLMTRRPRTGFVLAGIGVLVWLAEIALHFISYFVQREYELNHGILLVGGVIGFVGFFIIDPYKAMQGGNFVIDSASRVMRSLPRFGRRSTDAVAVPEAKTEIVAKPPSDERGT